ncbi:MAG: efflux RND transporter permease subunit [Deltaproteobacteria bacterium]|nr:efflux RND transporter permease subunit [Deltaproteobacteria bacterium]
MKFARVILNNWQFVIIMLLLLVSIGVFAILNMPRYEDPQVEPPGNSIYAVYPGTSPEEMERLIVDPIEKALDELDDIKRLEATVEDGLAVINIEFEMGSDADEKHRLVVEEVNQVRPDLPGDIAALEVRKWAMSDIAMLQIAISATANSNEVDSMMLERIADQLAKKLERTTGIKKVEIWAEPQEQVNVIMNLARMGQMHVPMSQLFTAIKSASASIPGGAVDIGPKQLSVRTSVPPATADQLAQSVVAAHNGNVIRLKDIAQVNLAQKPLNYLARTNGRRAVLITLHQKVNTNIMQIGNEIDEKLITFKKTLPKGVEITTVFNQVDSVKLRLKDFGINLLMGIVLVVAFIWLVLGWRAALIIGFAIPTSVLIALGWVNTAGFAIDQMTISGLVIALGMLVDNGIVITECIARYLRQGYSIRDAATHTVSEIAAPVISSTLTTVIVFLPIAFLSSLTGEFIRGMPVTVIAALTASLLLALTVTPLLASRFFDVTAANKGGILQVYTDYISTNSYPRILDKALKRPKTTLLIAVAILVASVGVAGGLGVSFFPKAEKPYIIINVDLPKGSSIDATNQKTIEVEQVLKKYAQIQSVTANVGHGNPRIYYNIIMKRDMPTHAQVLLQLQSYDTAETPDLVAKLRQEFADFTGVEIEVKELQQGPPIEAPLAIKILGDRLDTLRDVAAAVADIANQVSGVVNVNNPWRSAATDLRLVINRDKVARHGLTVSDVDISIRAALAGYKVAVLRDDTGEERDIVARATMHDRPTYEDLKDITLMTLSGQPVPLSYFARPEFGDSPSFITHYRRDRAATITADVRDGFNVAAVTQEVLQTINSRSWPEGISFHIAGEQEEREQSFGGMQSALIISLFAMFAVLVFQFRSIVQAPIVFVAIPLSIAGVFPALWLSGNSFSFTAFVGLASLAGIVVNNSIILIDYANHIRQKGMSVGDAIRTAGRTRLLPIILTTATTVGGLLPLTLRGGTLWAPMGWTIIGGLTASTLLTLLVVPVLYSLFTSEKTTATD